MVASPGDGEGERMNAEQLYYPNSPVRKALKEIIREVVHEEKQKEKEYEESQKRTHAYLLSLLGD